MLVHHFYSLLLITLTSLAIPPASPTPHDCTEALTTARPLSEADNVEYVLLRRRWPANKDIQKKIIRSLPPNVRLLLLDDLAETHTNSTIAAPASWLWVHDYLPETVINPQGQRELVSFEYASYQDWKTLLDARLASLLTGKTESLKPFPNSLKVAEQVADFLKLPLIESQLVMQGGHYMADEYGTIFVSRAILGNNRSFPTLEDVEAELKRVLYAKRVVWLPAISYEPTGHLDIYAMYLGRKKFLLKKVSDHNAGFAVAEAAGILERLGYTVDYLPSPDDRLYINSRRIGNRVLMPIYQEQKFLRPMRLDPADMIAKRKFEELGFEVVPIPATGLADSLGSLHCLTKTIPCL